MRLVFGDFSKLPSGAQRLIIYYTMIMFDGLGFFLTIYMFAIGFDVFVVGVLFSYLMLLTAVLRVAVGRLIDRCFPPKYLMFLEELLGVAAWVLLLYARSLNDFIIFFSIYAVVSIFGVAYRSIERDLYPQDMLEIAYKHHMFWPYFVQFLVVPLYGLFLNRDFVARFRILIFLSIVFRIFRTFYVLLFIPKTMPSRETAGRRNILRDLLSLPRTLVLIVVAEILVFVSYEIAPFFILENYLFNILGVGPLGISLVYSFGGLLGAIGVVIYDYLRKKGSQKLLYSALVTNSMASILLFVSQYLPCRFLVALLAICVMYVSWVIWWTVHETIIMGSVPSDLRGTVFGFVSAIKIILSIPLPIIAALIATRNSLAPFLVQAALFIFTLPIYFSALKLLSKNRGTSQNTSNKGSQNQFR